MTMINACPTCQKELVWDGQYYCFDCNKHYKKWAYCPECDAVLEKLQACGSVSYFCHTCNEVKSKSKARYVFQPLD